MPWCRRRAHARAWVRVVKPSGPSTASRIGGRHQGGKVWRWWVVVGLALLRGAWVAVAGSPVVSNDSSRYWNPIDPLSVFRVDVGLGPGQLVQ